MLWTWNQHHERAQRNVYELRLAWLDRDARRAEEVSALQDGLDQGRTAKATSSDFH